MACPAWPLRQPAPKGHRDTASTLEIMGNCSFLLGCFKSGLCLHFLKRKKQVSSFGDTLSREHPQYCLLFCLFVCARCLSSWDKALCILLIQEFVLVQINLRNAPHPDTEGITQRNSSKWWSCMGRPLLCLFPFTYLVLELPGVSASKIRQHGSLCKLYFTSPSLWLQVPTEFRILSDRSRRLTPKWVFCRKKIPSLDK